MPQFSLYNFFPLDYLLSDQGKTLQSDHEEPDWNGNDIGKEAESQRI